MNKVVFYAITSIVSVGLVEGCGTATPAVSNAGNSSTHLVSGNTGHANTISNKTTPTGTNSVTSTSNAASSMNVTAPKQVVPRNTTSSNQVPKNATAETPSGIPSSFRTYPDVWNSMGPYLARHTNVQVWLPTMKGVPNFNPKPWMNVQYSVTQKSYTLTVLVGPKLPPNSPKIIGGNANTIYSITALSKNVPVPKGWDWGTTAADAQNATKQSVNLGHGITGTLYSGNVPQGLSKSPVLDRTVVWKEEGWTFEWDGIQESTRSAIGFAEGMMKNNQLNAKLPIKSGEFISGEGSGGPSQVEFVVGNTRYIMYAPGGRALQIMDTLVHVQ